jgi:hypothetical protein
MRFLLTWNNESRLSHLPDSVSYLLETFFTPALMRKGRLIAKYEFKELEIEKAKTLSQKLGFTTLLNSPMTLTAIYNQDEKDFQQVKRNNSIGFKAIQTYEN